jgi:hypothetical protein
MAEYNNTGTLFQIGMDSEDEVLAIRAKAKELLLKGIVVLSWSGEGVESSKEFTMKCEDVLMETRLFLMRLNPSKYGVITNSSRIIRY